MASLEINSGFKPGVTIGPPGLSVGSEGLRTPRTTPAEWARRRREGKDARRTDAVRNRTLNRLTRLGPEWYLIAAESIGVDSPEGFAAIGPGGVFAVTVKSQGRNRVRLSGDVIQINGRRYDYIPESRRFADSLKTVLSESARTSIPVTPILALAGSGLISYYGLPKGCVVMPYRELDNLLSAYGDRIAPRTVEKLASLARQPATAFDLRSDPTAESYRWHSTDVPADKSGIRK